MAPLLIPVVGAGLGAIGVGAGTPLIISGALVGLTTGAAAVAEAISYAIVLGAGIGANVLVNSLNKKKNIQKTTTTINQALPPRWVDVGRVKTAGASVLYTAPSTFLYVVKVLSCTRIQEIETLFLNDWPTPGTGLNTQAPVGGFYGPWAAYVIAEARLGSPDQTALSIPLTSGYWTSAHRLRGLSAVAVQYMQAGEKQMPKVYPNGAPNPTAVIKGAWLPDPRNPAHDLSDPETWDYSDNAARALMRYCLDQDGWGLAPDDLNIPLWQAACDDCDDAAAAPGDLTEPRYRAWGRWYTTDERASTLANMLASMGGTLLEQPDGTLGLFVGKHREPTITIDDTMIIDCQMERFPDALSRVDGIRPRIIWEGAGWEEQECPTVYSEEPIYGAAPDVDDLALTFCPSPYQAQRLAHAALRQRRPEWQGTIKTYLHGLRVYGEPVVRLVYPELDIDGTFEIVSQPALDVSSMTVSLTLRSYAPDTWVLAPEDMGEMGDVGDTSGSYTPPAPEGLEATLLSDVLTLTWDAIPDEEAYALEAQWRAHVLDQPDEDGWAPMTLTGEGEAEYTPALGSIYDARVRRISSRGLESEWAKIEEIEE